jgi:hypothetical protein
MAVEPERERERERERESYSPCRIIKVVELVS